MWYTYAGEYYLALKKIEILPFAITWVDLEGIMLSEVSKTKKDKSNTIWFPLHVGSKEQNKWLKRKQKPAYI